MILKSASKGSGLSKELLPLKVPYLVREGWGFIALCIILFFPLAGVLITVLSWVEKSRAIPPAIDLLLLLLTFVVCFAGPFWLVGSLTSRFILQTVRHHLNQGQPELAEKVALLVDYQVWFREFRENEWFRQFLQERSLYERSVRYRALLAKLK
jgi:hypothetical protein